MPSETGSWIRKNPALKVTHPNSCEFGYIESNMTIIRDRKTEPAQQELRRPADVGATMSLAERYESIRALSRKLCETLEPEDCCIQSMPDVSPTRWHIAHTTWFLETFVL